MENIPIDSKPLSWWLNNAIERVKTGTIDKSDKNLLHVFFAWKEMSELKEEQVEELKASNSYQWKLLKHLRKIGRWKKEELQDLDNEINKH